MNRAPIPTESRSMTVRHHRLPWFKSRHLWLFVTLMLYLLGVPLVEELWPRTKAILDLFILLVMAAAAYSVIDRRRVFFFSLVLLFGGTILVLDVLPLPASAWQVLGCLLLVGFFGIVLVAILKDVLTVERVDFDAISGALSGYLLMGLLWGFAYQALELTWPGSFDFGDGGVSVARGAHYLGKHWSVLFYFSYVTLPTTGYGDVTPLSNPAGQLAITEAVVGQFYMVVLVARLVGLYSRKR